MSTKILLLLMLLMAHVLPIRVNAQTTRRAINPVQRTYASSSIEILSYLIKRPFYATSTKDTIIKNSPRATSTLLTDSRLYPIVQKRNNQYEESGNYYLPKCETEIIQVLPESTEVSYSFNTKTKITSSHLKSKNGAMNVTLPFGILSWKHYATSSSVVEMQKFNMQNTYYFEDKSGYTYAINADVYTYTPTCAEWLHQRNKFTSESVGGWSYGLTLFVPVETIIYEQRGALNTPQGQVYTTYQAYPEITNRWGGVFLVSPFEGSVRNKTSTWRYNSWYTFKKNNNIYYLSISTDNPKSRIFADQILTYFLGK
jgi:hypothetical protein